MAYGVEVRLRAVPNRNRVLAALILARTPRRIPKAHWDHTTHITVPAAVALTPTRALQAPCRVAVLLLRVAALLLIPIPIIPDLEMVWLTPNLISPAGYRV